MVIKIFVCFTVMSFLGVTRKQIQDINWQRKNEQLTGGAKLRELESKYVCLHGVLMSPSLRKMQVCFSSAVTLISVPQQLGVSGQ